MEFNDYRIDSRTGIKTEVSVVYKALKDNMLFAIKQAKDPKFDPLVVSSARIQMGLDHPNIVRVFRVELSSETGRPFIVMEYVDSPTLDSIISSREETPFEQKLSVMQDAARGLSYAHENGVHHGDFCPKNIFAGKPAKITDFCAQRIQRYIKDSIEIKSPFIASQNYLAPEQRENPAASKKADIYAFGVCALELMTGARVADLSEKNWPEILKKMIIQATSANPGERQDANTIIAQLEEAKAAAKNYGLIHFHNKPLQDFEFEDIEEAYKEIKIKGNSAAKSRILKAALMLSHPKRTGILLDLSFGEITDAVVSAMPDEFKRVSKHGRLSNDFAIAAARQYPDVAVEIFQYLLPIGQRDIIGNNLGAVLAFQGSKRALGYLQKSSIDEAKLNSALFYLSAGDHESSAKEAKKILDNPLLNAKAGAVLKTIARKRGESFAAHPDFAKELLMQRLSDSLARRVKFEHYEFAREAQVI